MPSYPVEIRIATIFRKRLTESEEGSLQRKVLMVLFENQLRRIDKLPRREISQSHAELLMFFESPAVQQEASGARAELEHILHTGSAQEKRLASSLIGKYERTGAGKRRTGQGLFDKWKPCLGGAPDSNRSRH